MNERRFWIVVVVVTVISLLLGYYFRAIMTPLALALFVAYLLDPLVTRLSAWRLPRAASIGLVFLLLLLAAATVGSYWATAISREFSAVQLNLPEYAHRLYTVIPEEMKSTLGIETPAKVQEKINQAVDNLKGTSLTILREAAKMMTRAFASTLGFVLTILGYFIIPVYLYYFLLDLPRLREGAFALVPVRYRDPLGNVTRQADTVLAAFVRGQLMVCLILAILYSLGLSLIGIELALVIGSLAGVLFIIPYVGTVIGMILAVIMAYLKFHDLLHPLLCLGWFGLVQLLEGSIITPRIVGTTVGLHPIMIIVTLMVFGQIGGLLGMLVAVPVMAVLNVVVKALLSAYRSSAFFQETV